MTEETRKEIGMVELIEPPMKPYVNPFPPKGKIYDYKFVKEVNSFDFYVLSYLNGIHMQLK